MARLFAAAAVVAIVSFALPACSKARLAAAVAGIDSEKLATFAPVCMRDFPDPPHPPLASFIQLEKCSAPANSLGCNWAYTSTVKHGEDCYVNCKPGFHSYHRFAACHDGKFNKELDCMPDGASCEAPPNSFGCNENYVKTLKDGEICNLYCKPGFHSDLFVSTCHNGKWNAKLACIPDGASCEHPPNSFGCHLLDGIPKDGENCVLHCKPGFHSQHHNVTHWLLSKHAVSKCSNGKLDAACVRNGAACQAPPESAGCGFAHRKTVEDGEFCDLKCHRGFSPRYEGFRCHKGQMVVDGVALRSLALPSSSPVSSVLLLPNPWLLAMCAFLVTSLVGGVVVYVRITIGWDSSHPGFSPRYLCSGDSAALPHGQMSSSFH